MNIKVKCIKDVYTQEYDGEGIFYPLIKVFTKGKIYDVEIVDNEWRTQDDDCPKEIPYNHIILNELDSDKSWFYEHFEII
jgi:hypothetical protein